MKFTVSPVQQPGPYPSKSVLGGVCRDENGSTSYSNVVQWSCYYNEVLQSSADMSEKCESHVPHYMESSCVFTFTPNEEYSKGNWRVNWRTVSTTYEVEPEEGSYFWYPSTESPELPEDSDGIVVMADGVYSMTKVK